MSVAAMAASGSSKESVLLLLPDITLLVSRDK